jgi:LemA protein
LTGLAVTEKLRAGLLVESRRLRSGNEAIGEHDMSTTGWIVLGVIAAIVAWVISVYNGLVAMGQRVSQAFADIDVQLRQRHDLIPNLVETVKGYAAHERGTLEAVIAARNAAVAAKGPEAQAAAEQQLSGMLGRLLALSEAYPDLKANASFQQLQGELTDIENKIAAARRFFNNAVSEYNARIAQFPAALFAASFGFASKQFFDLGEERKTLAEAPQVKF